ncbi:MAG: ABC transporter permease [Pseudomonadota bacterium]
MRALLPILTVVAVLIGFWYVATAPMNIHTALTQAEREGVTVTPEGAAVRRDMSALGLTLANTHVIPSTYSLDRPQLPAPHQVGAELWKTTVQPCIEGRRAWSFDCLTFRRSLVNHMWVTLSVTIAGFAIGAGLGIALAIGIVYNRAMDASVMPYVIVSQTIPILAIAPMIIVVLNAVGLQGFIPKAIVATYLSFFPVVVGMVKGLRSPGPMQLDQMRTWNASPAQTFWRLRLPASVPFLFPSLKVGAAAALVGTIIGEMPTGAVAGLGARMLAGSYYGQMIQIWSALFAAATLAAVLIIAISAVDKLTQRAMGVRP